MYPDILFIVPPKWIELRTVGLSVRLITTMLSSKSLTRTDFLFRNLCSLYPLVEAKIIRIEFDLYF